MARLAGFVVWGTGSGSRRDPDWFQNLRKAPTARVQVRERQLVVRPHELYGKERDGILARAGPPWSVAPPSVAGTVTTLLDGMLFLCEPGKVP